MTAHDRWLEPDEPEEDLETETDFDEPEEPETGDYRSDEIERTRDQRYDR